MIFKITLHDPIPIRKLANALKFTNWRMSADGKEFIATYRDERIYGIILEGRFNAIIKMRITSDYVYHQDTFLEDLCRLNTMFIIE